MIGQTLGHYKIVEKLGAGGMGEVYRAEDSTLKRQVALKVLPPDLAASQERLERFQREAESLAALDHPNIVHIYTVEEADGTRFLTMQLVDGKRLSEVIPRGGMSLETIFELAIPLADALSAAHEKGVIHRDLKPGNIMVTDEGRVKVLDFGLAKLRPEVDSPEATALPTEPLTEEGKILGTVPYMSPEQLEGKAVDARSDIFSLGVILYEMATGERPFKGGSSVSLISSIMKDTPREVDSLRAEVPHHLARIIRHCLDKQPQRRYQSALDVRNELEDLKTESTSGEVWRKAAPTPPRRRAIFWAAAAVLIAAVVGGLIFFFPGEPKLPPPEIIRLTDWAGFEGEPALSPDGDMVAFVQYGDEGPLLQVMMIGGGEALQIARGWGPTWSPDGQEIAFYRKLGNEDEKLVGIYLIPALGGIERRVAKSFSGYGLSWSPTGDLLAMVDRASLGQPNAIYLLSLETGEKQRLTEPPTGSHDFLPRLSRDGSRVTFSRKHAGADPDIFVVPVEGGMPLRLTEGNGRMWGGADWSSDGRDIIFSALRSSRTDWMSLWRMSASGGELERLFTEGSSGYPSVSLRGNRLAYTQAVQLSWGLWRVDIALSKRENDNPINLNTATGWNAFPEYSPDGRYILFGSNQSGMEEIWVSDSDGSNPRQLTYLDNGFTRVGSWSPDGRRIVFMSEKEGNQDIYVIDSTGDVPRRLTTGETEEALPSWSRDGRSVYYCSNRSGRFEVYRMPAEGGREVQITTNGGSRSFESPDGGSLFFAKGDPFTVQPQGLWRIPTEGGEEVKVLDGVSSMLWHVADDGIYYLDSGLPSPQDKDRERPAIEFFDFATGEVSRITEIEQPSRRGFAVSPDLRWALYGRSEEERDIMLVENFR